MEFAGVAEAPGCSGTEYRWVLVSIVVPDDDGDEVGDGGTTIQDRKSPRVHSASLWRSNWLYRGNQVVQAVWSRLAKVRPSRHHTDRCGVRNAETVGWLKSTWATVTSSRSPGCFAATGTAGAGAVAVAGASGGC